MYPKDKAGTKHVNIETSDHQKSKGPYSTAVYRKERS